ncbi:MAG: Ca-activated chloride channel family protein, partial [Parasphingorhabdus sp.]
MHHQITRKTLVALAVLNLTACSGLAGKQDDGYLTDISKPKTQNHNRTSLERHSTDVSLATSSQARPQLVEEHRAFNVPKELKEAESDSVQRIRATALAPAPASIAAHKKKREMGLVTTAAIQQHYTTIPSGILQGEKYQSIEQNLVTLVSEQPVSTFSIDVDTGSYSNVRRLLNSGHLPPRDAVRVEEMVNYFDYQYALNDDAEQPFSVVTEVGPSPWNDHKHLFHIGIKAGQVSEIPAANLVFLIDVSGSMRSADKLGLLVSSLKMLAGRMAAADRLSIVVYAGASGVVLEPVGGDQQSKIHSALSSLAAGGSTNGGAGIQLAYKLAGDAFIKDGINRIILATDGDFNVGTTNTDSLLELIEKKRKSGISLTTLGFGAGNYNDHLLEQLADAGNGNYAYVDTLNEAQKVLVDEMASTLNTVASDVKIQVEFNPAVVSEYRLIGYENRKLNREDFNNDKVDAGEVGSGHSVTALYEITLRDSNGNSIDALRYAEKKATSEEISNELAHLKIRYKTDIDNSSELFQMPVYKSEMLADIDATSDRFRFSAA